MSVRHTAYLVAHIYTDPTGRMLPQIHAVRIFSESATSLSAIGKNAAAVDVYHVQGDTYQEASDFLRFCVQTMDPFAWCRPLMELRDLVTVQRVTFAPMSSEEGARAADVIAKWRHVDLAVAARTLRDGIYLDRERYSDIVRAFEAAGCDVAVLWGAKSEAA